MGEAVNEKVQECIRLRAEGLRYREIAERTGLAISTAQSYVTDPTGEAVRRRKAKYSTPCRDCGVALSVHGRKERDRREGRCRSCHLKAVDVASRAWIIDSMNDWADLFGVPPISTDWNRALARTIGQDWRVARYEATGRHWPSAGVVQKRFGSWNAGIQAAGFDPTPVGAWLRLAGETRTRNPRAAKREAA